MRRVGLLVLVCAVAAGAVGAAYASKSPKSPKALRAAMLTAARRQHSVHWTEKARYPGAVYTFVSNVGRTKGTQKITLKTGGQTAHLTVKLVDKTAYIEGDEPGLELVQELTQSQAEAYAGQWISIPKGDRSHRWTVDALSLSSLIRDLSPRGAFRGVTGKLHGRAVVGVRGTSGKGKKRKVIVLYAHARGKKLPLEQLWSSRGFSSRVTLSKWNEKVSVQAPATSTPIATVRQS